MRALIFLCTVLFLAPTVSAQILNGGFESNSGLPVSTGEWNLVDNWTNAGSAFGNPDYFHENGGLGGDLPETPIAIVNAYEGEAIMGFIATGRKGTNKREYLQTKFNQPLVPGDKYYVEFHIANGNITSTSTAGLGTSNLAIAFTTAAPVQNGDGPLNLNPQFEIHGVQFDRNWDKIAFSFTATEPFEFLTMGVFGDDTDKDIQEFEGDNPNIAYYFVDDFQMTTIPNDVVEDSGSNKYDAPDEPEEDVNLEDQFFIPNAFTPNGDGDNDFWRPVVPELSDYKLCIYSRWGELLFTTNQIQGAWDGSSPKGKGVESGMYIWELSYVEVDEFGNQKQRSKNGTVNLLR